MIKTIKQIIQNYFKAINYFSTKVMLRIKYFLKNVNNYIGNKQYGWIEESFN